MTTTENASPNTSPSMGQLAQAAMPAGTQQMIANIDTILASAKQVIDQSIMQSEALIAKSQHQLDADVSANPAPASEATPSAPLASTPTATDTPEQEALLKEQQQYQQTMLAQQQKTQQAAQEAQQALANNSAKMSQNLLAQQQAYESNLNQYATKQLEQLTPDVAKVET
ncbi:hypothetical protein [Shewanella waksmanii]|uniref:hypothetical protein n=1 Tax=Shewanella waksmanii TaxID=213783 RepID=UPI00048EA17D|nr:hypothetical protein [Shewanella waksmanii]